MGAFNVNVFKKANWNFFPFFFLLDFLDDFFFIRLPVVVVALWGLLLLTGLNDVCVSVSTLSSVGAAAAAEWCAHVMSVVAFGGPAANACNPHRLVGWWL